MGNIFYIKAIIFLLFFIVKIDYVRAMEREYLINSSDSDTETICYNNSSFNRIKQLFTMAKKDTKNFSEPWPCNMYIAFGVFFLIEVFSIVWFTTCRFHHNDNNYMSEMFCTSNYATFFYSAIKFSSLLPIILLIKGHGKFMVKRVQKFILNELQEVEK